MTIFCWILLSTFLISLIAFVGALFLFLNDKLLNKILLILVSFASGTLIGASFLHLLPEAIEEIGFEKEALFKIFLFSLFGFCVFYVLENFIGWHHHHAKEHPEVKPFSYLILISDSIHNFIDGLIVASSFLISFPLGVTTAIAVAFHEIPQEIGDFGVLVYGGMKKIKALFLNFFSASAIIFGGLFGFFLSEKIGKEIIFLLPFAAGSFIYIAASDLIPQIKETKEFQKSVIYFLFFLAGIGIMLFIELLH